MSDSSIRPGCLEEATITIDRAKFDIAKSTDSWGVPTKTSQMESRERLS